jgi:cobalt-precorrin-5B (C1)-methyltransferase
MKKLRSGYTTGACAAAAAKGAVLAFLGYDSLREVQIPFPDGQRVRFILTKCGLLDSQERTAMAAVIKDAGDDPDVTNGAVIEAYVCYGTSLQTEKIVLTGGKGVGLVTKPGLAVEVGKPAINPVPERMIREAVKEAFTENNGDSSMPLIVTISIPEGEHLARKTLNKRLGIIGGLSILGTTGIVRPVSAEAWTATITASMNVALKAGVREIVLATGRTSERAVQEKFSFQEEALVMMGDYLKFSLLEAGKFQFSKIHIAGMWAKILKGAMRIPQTHVKHGALEVEQAITFISGLGVPQETTRQLEGANTAREIYARLVSSGNMDIVEKVCRCAKEYCEITSLLSVNVYLIDASGRIVVSA